MGWLPLKVQFYLPNSIASHYNVVLLEEAYTVHANIHWLELHWLACIKHEGMNSV